MWPGGDSSGPSDFNLQVPVTGVGFAAGAGEFSNEAFGYWRAPGYGWYSKRWGGNGSTGGKLAVLKRARGFRLFGRAAFVVGVGNSLYQYYQGNISGTKAGFDIGFGIAGQLGPYGFAPNAI